MAQQCRADGVSTSKFQVPDAVGSHPIPCTCTPLGNCTTNCGADPAVGSGLRCARVSLYAVSVVFRVSLCLVSVCVRPVSLCARVRLCALLSVCVFVSAAGEAGLACHRGR